MKGGGDLRHELRRALDLGCTVEPVHKSGDYRVSHPAQSRSLTISGHRRDAPRSLTTYLNQVERGTQKSVTPRR